ncbi:hypothetical protein KZC56_04290 [Microbacterium sp. SSW1-47]|uniref:hypothetical protein n=1 Tax=Microbacterium TaxID=33882 RepID=UPI00109BE7A1|nr:MULTISPECIES: hypothetical protein [Microbacterium]MCK2025509.1 hypothetical protein [Microbacterium sufflavum]
MKTPIVLTAALATALIASPAAAIASAPPTSIMSTMNVPARDLGPCWAQAGRVVGGGIGVIGSSVTAPWAFPGLLWAYLGAMSQETYTSDGQFAC